MRAWLLSNTTYGTWLPGDPRGSVTSVRDRRPGEERSPIRIEHDIPGELYEEPMPALRRSARQVMAGPPIYLDTEKANRVLRQFQETAEHRDWTLRAVAIMANHFHIVVQVPGDPSPGRVLGDFKAYASRVLNREYGMPPSETWWTAEGSKRKLKDDVALSDGINYVLYRQEYPLLVWCPELGFIV